jgi:putative endopeptidase
MIRFLAILIFVPVLFFGCKLINKNTDSFFDKSGMDLTVKPGDDFFQYANGTWFRRTRIPADQSGWGSFFYIYDNNLKALRSLLDSLSSAPNAKETLEQKAGDFYASGMDSDGIEKKGYQPLVPMLQKIDSVKTWPDLISLVATAMKDGDGDLFGLNVDADEKNSARNIVILSQTGLTLPEKSYYVKTDSLSGFQRQQLADYVTRLFILTGTDSGEALRRGQEVLSLETAISRSHRAPVELRDPQANYNKLSIAELQKRSPLIAWKDVFDKMGIHTDSINVQQPGYYEQLGSDLAGQPIEAWKVKVAFDYINGKTALLGKNFRDASFGFHRIFSGQKSQPENWKRIVSAADRGLRDVVGELYVQRYFPPEAKQRMTELVDNLQKAFSARIGRLDWMSDTTKQKAQQKLAAFLKKIAYPSKWKSYQDVEVTRDDYFVNNMQIARHNFRDKIAKIGKSVDRSIWGMTPPTVNAYYNPTYNEIVFPAGILQSPFFDPEADDAINYGGIGMVIGHEMTHGFDDQGRQYDADGNLKDWWTKEDAVKFKAKADGAVKQYDQYTVLDTVHVNGALTLGENLADIGGVAIAYEAFKMTEQGKGEETIDGLTPDQRFFLGFAQAWRLKIRPESMRVKIATDEHSPERFRVDGPLSELEPFYKAFGISENDKMYRKPEDRVLIW